MKTFVIRCNDSVEAVVIGDEQFANAEMERRRAADHRRDCCTFGDPCPTYAHRMYWRVHEYDAAVQGGSVQPIGIVRKAARFVEPDGVMTEGSAEFCEAMRVLVNYALYGAPVEVREMAALLKRTVGMIVTADPEGRELLADVQAFLKEMES